MKRFSEFKFGRINEQEITLISATNSDSTSIVVSATPPVAGATNSVEQSQATDDNTEPVEEKSTGDHVSKFFSKLFESRQVAHVFHLQVRGDNGSYAAHVALDVYYNTVLGFIDELIEIYQGQYGIIENYDSITIDDVSKKDKIQYFEELAKSIKEDRKCILEEDTHLHNIIDEIAALIYKTLYKLKYNK